MWNVIKLLGLVLNSKWFGKITSQADGPKDKELTNTLNYIKDQLAGINVKLEKQGSNNNFTWTYGLGFSMIALAAATSGITFPHFSILLIFLAGFGLVLFAILKTTRKF